MESLFPSPVVPVKMVHPRGISRSARPVILLLFALLLIPQGAFAHPPSDMQPGIQEGDRLLSVTITHTVADPAAHYVNRVLVTAGGITINDTAYTSQPTANTFTYTYPLPQGISGEILVKAECSIAGSITRSLGIQGAAPTPSILPVPPEAPVRSPAATAPAGDTTPVPAATSTRAGPGLLPLIAGAALAVWRFRR
jgi:hypothetical protein